MVFTQAAVIPVFLNGESEAQRGDVFLPVGTQVVRESGIQRDSVRLELGL